MAYSVFESDARIRRHCESLARAGHRVLFLGLGSSDQPRVSRRNGVMLVCAARRRYRGASILRYFLAYTRFIVFSLWTLNRRFRTRRLQTVQTNNLPNALGIVGWLMRRRGVVWVHDVHDPEPELFRSKFGGGVVGRAGGALLQLIERTIFRRADRVLLANPPTTRMLSELSALGDTRWRVIPNLPDQRIFGLTPPRPKGTKRIVFHGTLTRRYNLEVVLRALAEMRKGEADIAFHVIGNGDQLDPLRRLARELDLGPSVAFSGCLVPLEQIPRLIRDAVVGVVPLRRDAFVDAVFPTKLLEYVRLGIPCVVTPTVAVTRAFPLGTLLYAADDGVADWYRALRVALTEKVDIMRMAAAAQTLPIVRAWQEVEAQYVTFVAEGTTTRSPEIS